MDDCVERYNIGSFEDYGMVFFPLLNRGHFWCVVFNLESGHIFVLDNLADRVAASNYYEELNVNLRDRFCAYLSATKQNRCRHLERVVPCKLTLEWQTRMNGVDCGVFLMRHMEMFKGVGKFDAGLRIETDRQQAQLDDLRKKYAARILTSQLNSKVVYVKLQAKDHAKLPQDFLEGIAKRVEEVREERLAMFGK